LNIPSVGAGDTNYDNLSGLSYSLESQSSYPSIGEDNEIAVQRIIWDLYDGVDPGEKDEVALGDATIWQIIKNQHPKNLYDIWLPFTSGKPLSEVVKYGAIFAEHKVASLPKEPADNTKLADLKNPVTFRWDANGAGPSYKSDKFTVEFYTKDFSKLLFTSPEQTTPEFTATVNNLKSIFATESEIKWIVKSSNSSTPVTGPYTSPAFTLKATPEGVDVAFIIDDTGSMSEEIGGVRNALLNFLSKFTEESGLVFQLTTFKDNVTSRAPTTNLTEIKNQVAALVASGGDDCPEASVEALDAVKDNIKDGRLAIIATDASPHTGLDIAGITASLAARGVKVHTLLSGDCSGSSAPAVTRDGKTLAPPPYSDNGGGSKAGPAAGTSGLSNPTAIEAFSYISQETKGIFAYVPEVNGSNENDKKRYENIGFNILVGATSTAVAFVEPYRAPAGSTLTTTITGVNTNFNASSSISFAGTSISISSINVISPTKIEATISIPAGTALGLKDITVTTGSEVALGAGLLEVTAAPVTPMVISITPPSGSKGQSLTVSVSGANTHFTDASVLNLGSGITVSSVKAISATQLQAAILIAADATPGYRNVVVTTGSEVADENVIGPFLVIEAGCTPITIAGVTIPSGGTATLTASGCAGTLLWSTGATTSTIMVGPLTESTTVSATCTTGACVVSATGAITVQPSGGLALVAPTYNCSTGAFTFNTTGGDGSPITFFAIGITGPTTNPNQFVDTEQRTMADAPPIVLYATQSGVTVSYIWNIRAVCPVGGLTLLEPTYNCSTGAFTFNTTGGDGSPITFFAIGITGPTTNPNQFVDTELRTMADAPLITLQATQNGVTVSYVWNIRAVCPVTPGGSLTLLAPTYNCSTGAFKFNTSGGDGSPIEYRAVPGITDWTTNPNQFVDEGSRTANDVQPFLLQARQNGVVTTLVWDLKVACGRARLAATESLSEMHVTVLGNPVAGETVDVEVSGVERQSLQLQLSNFQGQLVSEEHIKQAAAIERVKLQLSKSAGVYLLQVSSPNQLKVIRVLKVN